MGGLVHVGGNRSKGANRMYFLLVVALDANEVAEELGEPVVDRAREARDACGSDHISPFWDVEANGPLVQLPLQLDWRGRSWSKSFSINAINSSGEICTQAGTFGVCVGASPGIFHKTKVVTVYPRFVVSNMLNLPVCAIPCLEKKSEEKGGPRLGSSSGVRIR
ncbi:unnamed protein product, partial [Chrysoparadoxa australica]